MLMAEDMEVASCSIAFSIWVLMAVWIEVIIWVIALVIVVDR